MSGFEPESTWSKPVGVGRPPVPIPEELQVILERTYANKTVFTLEVPAADDPAAQELIRCGRIYATRQKLKFHHQFGQQNGRPVIKIKMRDPRPYTPRKR